MFVNYYDYIQDIIGDKIRSDNHPIIRRLSLKDLCQIREKYHKGFHAFAEYIYEADSIEDFDLRLSKLKYAPLPYKRTLHLAGEFRPLLHGQIHESTYVFGGDEGHPWASPDHTKRLALLRRYLLYSHRIILPDPFWYINQYLHLSKGENQYVVETRLSLANFLDFLYVIRKLIQSEIISFYPQYEHSRFSDDRFIDERFCDWASSQTNDEDELLLIETAHDVVIKLLFFCIRHGATYSLDKTRLRAENATAKLNSVLDTILRYGQALGGSDPITKIDVAIRRERSALERLAKIDLPRLDDISIKEIVAVRRGSEGFNRWRESLQEGLLRIESSDVNSKMLREAVVESLANGKNALEAELHKSSMLSIAKKQSASFVVGALAGMVAGDPTGGLATGTASAALSVLKEFFLDTKEQTTRRTLLKHYTLWTDEVD